jgi:hypothetical protein
VLRPPVAQERVKLIGNDLAVNQPTRDCCNNRKSPPAQAQDAVMTPDRSTFHDGEQPFRSHSSGGVAGWDAELDWDCHGLCFVALESAAGRIPKVSILPCVLERAEAPRHMLPYGKKDRPIYATASPPPE